MDANYFPTYRWLAMAYLGKSMPEQALQEAQKAAALSNNSTEAMADLAISYAASSKTKEATSILRIRAGNHQPSRKFIDFHQGFR